MDLGSARAYRNRQNQQILSSTDDSQAPQRIIRNARRQNGKGEDSALFNDKKSALQRTSIFQQTARQVIGSPEGARPEDRPFKLEDDKPLVFTHGVNDSLSDLCQLSAAEVNSNSSSSFRASINLFERPKSTRREDWFFRTIDTDGSDEEDDMCSLEVNLHGEFKNGKMG